MGFEEDFLKIVRETWRDNLGVVVIISEGRYQQTECHDPLASNPRILEFTIDGVVYTPQAAFDSFDQDKEPSHILVQRVRNRFGTICEYLHGCITTERPLPAYDRQNVWFDHVHDNKPYNGNMKDAMIQWKTFSILVHEDFLGILEKRDWHACDKSPGFKSILYHLGLLAGEISEKECVDAGFEFEVEYVSRIKKWIDLSKEALKARDKEIGTHRREIAKNEDLLCKIIKGDSSVLHDAMPYIGMQVDYYINHLATNIIPASKENK